MGCCNGGETEYYDETDPLLRTPQLNIQGEPSLYKDAKSLVLPSSSIPAKSPRIPTLSNLAGGSTTFSSVATFSVMYDNEQKLLEHIVKNTHAELIDISQVDQEILGYEALQERMSFYREQIAQEAFKPVKEPQDILDITTENQIGHKSIKFILHPADSVPDADLHVLRSGMERLSDSLGRMSVTDYGPIFVSFDM